MEKQNSTPNFIQSLIGKNVCIFAQGGGSGSLRLIGILHGTCSEFGQTWAIQEIPKTNGETQAVNMATVISIHEHTLGVEGNR